MLPLIKKDSPTAIDAYKKELALVPLDATKTPGPVLQDMYYLGAAYLQATPPDYLNCAFYASRAVAYAPDNFKTSVVAVRPSIATTSITVGTTTAMTR